MNVYSYVITHDAGSAPNYEGPATTLAICKPRIRAKSKTGDLVIAFQGATLGPEPHGVRWAGLVSEKLTFAEYWNDRRFAQKKPDVSAHPDNIYRPVGSVLVRVENRVHGPEDVVKDLGGECVLVLGRSWRFGASAPVLPEEFGLRLVAGRRSHRIYQISEAVWEQLRDWLDEMQGNVEIPNTLPSGGCKLTANKTLSIDAYSPRTRKKGKRC